MIELMRETSTPIEGSRHRRYRREFEENRFDDLADLGREYRNRGIADFGLGIGGVDTDHVTIHFPATAMERDICRVQTPEHLVGCGDGVVIFSMADFPGPLVE